MGLGYTRLSAPPPRKAIVKDSGLCDPALQSAAFLHVRFRYFSYPQMDISQLLALFSLSIWYFEVGSKTRVRWCNVNDCANRMDRRG